MTPEQQQQQWEDYHDGNRIFNNDLKRFEDKVKAFNATHIVRFSAKLDGSVGKSFDYNANVKMEFVIPNLSDPGRDELNADRTSLQNSLNRLQNKFNNLPRFQPRHSAPRRHLDRLPHHLRLG